MIVVENLENIIPPTILDALTPKVLDSVLEDIATAAQAEWIRLAKAAKLRGAYIDAIQDVRMTPGTAIISLVGVVANEIEHGRPKTHLHELLLGPKVPVKPLGQKGKRARKAGGFYRAIPFRHTGADTAGVLGQPTGKPYTGHELVTDSKKLGRAIFKQMKARSV